MRFPVIVLLAIGLLCFAFIPVVDTSDGAFVMLVFLGAVNLASAFMLWWEDRRG